MMRRGTALVLVALSLGSASCAATYQVTNTDNSGSGSLRWAINQANSRLGPDTITFVPDLKGSVIEPKTQLPSLWALRTTINGDIDGNGAPDIWLRGKKQRTGHGIDIQSTSCRIIGLAITHFPGYGIHIVSAHHNTVRSCHLGVNLAGTGRRTNRWGAVFLEIADHNTIRDNVIASGPGGGGGHLHPQ